MQLVQLFLVSLFVTVGAPIVLMAFSAYTLYTSIALAKLSDKRHAELESAATVGRYLATKSAKKTKSPKA